MVKEREREGDGEEDKDRWKEKGETSGREHLNDMEMIVPAAHHTKHFHSVIFSVLMSRENCELKNAESCRGVLG